MSQDRKKDTAPADTEQGNRPRTREEKREDAEASRQDRPTTSVPGQKERWENEGGQPGGVISSTDATQPKTDED
jgi:hypothetical protein